MGYIYIYYHDISISGDDHPSAMICICILQNDSHCGMDDYLICHVLTLNGVFFALPCLTAR